MTPFFLLFLAYVLGATPSSLWVGRVFHGVDLRREGSGNLGATNAFRVLGWQAALPVMLADVLKGFVPVALFPNFAGTDSPAWLLAFGAAAILGHVFSFWVGFRGGKGVATSAGVFLALAPWALLIGFGVWLGLVLLTRIVSVGSIAAALVLPLAVLLTPSAGGDGVVIFAVLLGLFVIWAHRSNLRRLVKGTEARIGESHGGRPTTPSSRAPEPRRREPDDEDDRSSDTTGAIR